jgi:hypothetical protein
MANTSPNTKGLVKFEKGNKLGRGNPLGGKIEKLRAAIIASVTPEDFKQIALALLSEARAGNVKAAKELFDRVLGKARQQVEVSDAGAGQEATQVTPETLARAAEWILQCGGTVERLPPMLRAAYERGRQAQQVNSNVVGSV